MEKRMGALLLALVLILSVVPVTAYGAETVATGVCGDNLSWKLTGDGVLQITGTGDMWEYEAFWTDNVENRIVTSSKDYFIAWPEQDPVMAPWAEFFRTIRNVEIAQGVTSVGNCAFWACEALETVTIPDSVKTVGDTAFGYCSALETAYLGAGVTDIGGCFYECTSLKKITFGGAAPKCRTQDVVCDGAAGLRIYYHSSAGGWEALTESVRLPEGGMWLDLDSLIKPEEFAFDRAEYVVELGGEIPLSHNADGITALDLRWSVSQQGVLHMLPGGTAIGLRPGTVTVTATTGDGRGSSSCQVTVAEGSWAGSAIRSLSGKSANNLSKNDYDVYDKVKNAFLCETEDGLDRIQFISGTGVVISRYNGSFALVEEFVIQPELGVFGGFFAGENYNFLLYGQNNPNQSAEREVLRIVKYTKDWGRLDSASLYDINTTVPFRAGNADFAEAGGKLYLHTCHEMYQTPDGKNHQANMTFVLDQQTMEVVDYLYGISNFGTGYVSHSFSQRIRTDGEYVYRADHGDAHPRTITLTKVREDEGIMDVQGTHLLSIPGEEGANQTGVSLGGLELVKDSAVVAGNAVDVSNPKTYNPKGQRNIFLSSTAPGAGVTWLTNFTASDGVKVRTPQLVAVSDRLLMVLWEQSTSSGVRTAIALVDGYGNQVCRPFNTDLRLSDCQPILTADGRVCWFVADGNGMKLYSVSWQQMLADRSTAERVLGHSASPFSDVKRTDYFYEPVLWAVDNGITSGLSATKFGPGNACTRGQIVTFLWAACGRPEPESRYNPFNDVKETDYFYKAVLWAVENGITSGMSETEFGSSRTCTRGQVVTFLWAALGRPEPENTVNTFADVKDTDYFRTAVLWAVENDITSGVGTGKFGPGNVCTRGQIVTFLYKSFAQ